MLSTALPPVLFLVATFSAPALDDVPGEDCVLFLADNYTRAWAEAKDRNVPVVILSWDGWRGEHASSIDAYYADRSFLKAADHAVVIVCSQHKHGETKQRVRGETRTVCGQFGCFPPGTAARMMNPVFQDFAEGGILKTPLAIVTTPDKEVI